MSTDQKKDAKAILWMLVAYALALLVAGTLMANLSIENYMLKSLVADVGATLVIFIFSIAFNNSSFYDPFWSVAPIVLVFAWINHAELTTQTSLRAHFVLLFVIIWGIRLTWNFLRGWKGLKHEDWRYVDLKEKHGKAYWFVSFGGIHLFPTFLVFVGCLGAYPAIFESGEMNMLDILGILVCASGMFLEATADAQLRKHVMSGKTNTLNTGLWSVSRHPNYLGEILFWWGLAIMGFAADSEAWGAFMGAILITLLFIFISIPMIDKRMLSRRVDYAEYKKQVPALFPWFGKRLK